MKPIKLLYGKEGMVLRVPDSARVLEGQDVPALPRPHEAVLEALRKPIGSPPLGELVARRRPQRVAISISDITRPVPNRQFLPALLAALNAAGVPDSRITIVIATGTHRPSTPQERDILVGSEVLSRIAVVDHNAYDPSTLTQVCAPGEAGPGSPPVRVCRAFAEADFRIVTGFIEPHFMAGFSGGRKGVCPGLVDLDTIRWFHGYRTLADPRSDNGVLAGNPCHAISLAVARRVGVDFLFNVAITRDRRMAGIYCGDMQEAHQAGCRAVSQWVSAAVDQPLDLVITSGGGVPLDQNFYQTVKGMCTALPALGPGSTLLIVSRCNEGLGSAGYARMLLRYGDDWRRFLADIAADPRTELEQWEIQMQARVLERIGVGRLWLASDGIDLAADQRIGATLLAGAGDARERAQAAVDGFMREHPHAKVAVIPEGPYVLLSRGRA